MNKRYQGHSPEIHPEAFIVETAMLIGQVSVGAESSVWYGAVLRGDQAPIRIGRGSSIQDNAVIHCEKGCGTVVGDNVTVGHGAIIHGSRIGNNSLIGMGAVVLNGCDIGEECIIAAGCVVRENAVIPAGSMVVGVPGKILRPLSEAQRAAMAQPSPYVELARNYREEEER